MSGLRPTDGDVGAAVPRVSRREALKRGAAVGGAMLWATPVVHVLAVSPVAAQTVSPVPGPGPGPDQTTTTVDVRGTTATTSRPTTTTTTTTAREPGDAVTTTAPPQVLGVQAERTTPVLAAPPAVQASELRRTGSEIADLVALGGATTAVGAAALAWARRRHGEQPGEAEPTGPAGDGGVEPETV